MSHTNYITNLLYLKDRNVHISDNIYTKTIKWITYKVIDSQEILLNQKRDS